MCDSETLQIMKTKSDKLEKLRVGFFNIFHLAKKVPELSLHLTNSLPFHIFGLNETRLKDHHDDGILHIPNYIIHRRDKDPSQKLHTGVAAYVHTSIQHLVRRRKDLESDSIECLWLELKELNRRSHLIGIVYRNPDEVRFDWYDRFIQMSDTIGFADKNVHLLGDFNIDLLRSDNAWECTLELIGLTQFVPLRRTRVDIRTGRESLLDHIYSNCPELIKNAKVDDLGLSDHFPISCNLNLNIASNRKTHKTVTYRSFKKFNATLFLHDLEFAPFRNVFNENDPNAAIETWYDIFLSILDKHAPLRTKRVKQAALPPWLTPEVIKATELKKQLKREKKNEEFKAQRNLVKKIVRKAKKSYCNSVITNNNDTRAIWKALSVITSNGGKNSNASTSSIDAETLNNHFLSVAESLIKTPNSVSYECPTLLRDFCSSRTSEHEPLDIPLLAVHEVGRIIDSMKNKKSSGFDEISPKLLKLALPYIVESLTYVYNLCIKQNIFPDKLKHAKVIALPKSKKDLSDVNNYRPISLLASLSKPLEKHIHTHLLSYLESRKLLYAFQSGFRPTFSCHTALTRLVDNWLNNINNKKLSGVVFLDLRKAFDLINHDILLQKLKHYILNQDTVNLIRSYLTNRTQQVLSNGLLSNSSVIKLGVPQGSILGPILFSVFINDLPLAITSDKVATDLFADDATIHATDKDINNVNAELQIALGEVSSWCSLNDMVINPSKTEAMVITTRQKHQLRPLLLNITVNDIPVKEVNKHRLLGVVIDKSLSWQNHIEMTCKTLSRHLYVLSQLKHITDENTRRIFYEAHIKSHIDYASTLWDGLSDNIFKKLSSLYRRAAKLINPDITLNTDQKLKSLDMLPLKDHLLFNKSTFMYKFYSGSLPPYLDDVLPKINQSKYANSRCTVTVPKPRIDMYKTSLCYSGGVLWNSLPTEIKHARSLATFKTRSYRYFWDSNKS